MQKLGIWLSLIVAAAIALLALMNWNTLSSPTSVELGATRIVAPIGLLMLGLTAALIVVFLIVLLRNQLGFLIESRKLLKEVQRLQALADQAEASRMESLNHLVVTEFRQLNRRLDALVPVAETPLLKLP
ncbi:MAG: LapA family protein [Rubrivivax sp.]|nr:LapA family protein [Rubrivivax sp.]MBK7260414.1 LapA family protein [Rubrivivax sp.]MBK8526090.1 LapA family protein [Rubrivivax sp.]